MRALDVGQSNKSVFVSWSVVNEVVYGVIEVEPDVIQETAYVIGIIRGPQTSDVFLGLFVE